jgi:hypothetical protein
VKPGWKLPKSKRDMGSFDSVSPHLGSPLYPLQRRNITIASTGSLSTSITTLSTAVSNDTSTISSQSFQQATSTGTNAPVTSGASSSTAAFGSASFTNSYGFVSSSWTFLSGTGASLSVGASITNSDTSSNSLATPATTSLDTLASTLGSTSTATGGDAPQQSTSGTSPSDSLASTVARRRSAPRLPYLVWEHWSPPSGVRRQPLPLFPMVMTRHICFAPPRTY